MKLDYFLDPALTLFQAGQQFFEAGLDLTLNALTAQPVPPRAFLKGYADKAPALDKVRDVYFLGELSDQALRENAARRRGEAALGARIGYADLAAPIPGRAYPGLLVFALDCNPDLPQPPSRAEIAELTRAFNRANDFRPVLLLLRYQVAAAPQERGTGGVRLALAASERSEYLQPWRPGEKVGKITTLFDIDPRPDRLHAGHATLLAKLRVPTDVDSLRALSQHWNRVLSVQVLNKEFYRELSNWYFWAVRRVKTPAYDGDQGDDVRHATALIRLITRLVFTWFLKEKHLVPGQLFDEAFVYEHLLRPALDDPHGSTYYKAILQNLFFATLNTEMRDPADPRQPNRRFVPAGQKYGNPAYGEAGFLRYEPLFTAPGKAQALDLFNQVPFLNGGLFECLDPTPPKSQPRSQRVLIDCFSNEHQDKLNLPDELFFGAERPADLSLDYGDAARKKEKVRGLLRILKGYTFTITENTPLEEEVALDPELLGKVFENLLAAYNPETQTTARKQTGSFYTPREVVEYMVDESLLAYLRPHLPAAGELKIKNEELKIGAGAGAGGGPRLAQTKDQPDQNLFGEVKPEQATLGLTRPALADPAPIPHSSFLIPHSPEAALRHLLATPDAPNPFDEPATWRLIDALDRLKLLDPACGSGAFPMGALQRLTYLLARLDPNNRRWKQLQLDRAEADRQSALTFLDAEVKRQALAAAEARKAEIKAAFDTNNHELDYGRKLYLIENCLYGVDIQPVAVQITKLRCFIALLVEQKATAALAHSPERNLGIRPLPNLETKFVAANTLLRLESEGGQQSTVSLRVEALQAELKEVRHQYFTVRGRVAKLALKAQDRAIRESLRREFRASMMSGPDAERLANWDPYDLRAAADFFSPEWMLNVPTKPDANGQAQGFDVVIGNPPYVRQEKFTALKPKLQKIYPASYDGKADLYVYFYDRALQVLKSGGVLCYITSNKYFLSGYGLKLRNFLRDYTSFLQIINFGDAPVFDAIAYPTIILTQKQPPRSQHSLKTLMWQVGPAIETFPSVFADKASLIPQTALRGDGWQFGKTDARDLLNKLRAHGMSLEVYAAGKIFRGVVTGLNDAFVIDDERRTQLIKADPASQKAIKPFLIGRDVKRYSHPEIKRYLLYIPWNFELDKFPAIKAHLMAFKPDLQRRPEVMQNRFPWYALSRYGPEFVSFFNERKILWPGISLLRAPFGFDINNQYANDNVHFIASDDLYLLGVLNSRVTAFVNELTCDQVQNGYLRMKIAYVKTYPIPSANPSEKKQIETRVTKILTAKAASPPADTTALEAEIDVLVYRLYGLTHAEVLLVEPGFGLSAAAYAAVPVG